MPTALPSLVVVTGRPGSGKSTLVHPLARALRLPLISRDEIKEGMATAPDQNANAAFFNAIRLLLDHGVGLVAEAAFQHRLWAPNLEPLRAVAEIRAIVLTVDAALAQARHENRAELDAERGRFHDVGPLNPTYEPPRLGLPTLGVDTTDGYRPSFEEIVLFAQSRS